MPLLFILALQDQGSPPPVPPSLLPPGMTSEEFDAGMRAAVVESRRPHQRSSTQEAVCADVRAAMGYLLQERESALAMRDQLDDAYFEQSNANAATAATAGRPNQWQDLAMQLLVSKRSEMTGRIEDQNGALYALARVGFAFCDGPSRP